MGGGWRAGNSERSQPCAFPRKQEPSVSAGKGVAIVSNEIRSLDKGTNLFNETVFCNSKGPQDFASKVTGCSF